jgi:hypothetical protein
MPITNAPPPVKPAAPKTAAVTGTVRARSDALASFGQIAQVPLVATRQYADAGAVAAHWPSVSLEIAKLAETVPQVARLVDPLLQIGPYAGLIAAVLPLVLQLGVNHGRVPAGAMGTVPATTLASQVEAALAQEELKALKVQYEAEKAAGETRAEILRQREEFSYFAKAGTVDSAA